MVAPEITFLMAVTELVATVNQTPEPHFALFFRVFRAPLLSGATYTHVQPVFDWEMGGGKWDCVIPKSIARECVYVLCESVSVCARANTKQLLAGP